MLAAGLTALLILLGLYAARKMIAREALTGWLRSHGVAAQSQVQDIGLGGVAGRVQIGPASAPDFVAGDASIGWGLERFSLRVRTVTLQKPVLRARWHAGMLTVGSLDPLIADLLKRPPTPNQPSPRVTIRGGLLLLATDYGPVRMTVDAVVDDGKLVSLAATTAPTRLHLPGLDADLGAVGLSALTRAGRVAVGVDAPATRLAAAGATGAGVHLRLNGELPYPDLKARRLDGPVRFSFQAGAGDLSFGGATLHRATANGNFDGESAGPFDALAFAGPAEGVLGATEGRSGAAEAAALRITATTRDLSWSRAQGFSASILAAATGQGRWTGLGPPRAGDAAQVAAIKRAARSLQVSAPAVALVVRPGVTTVSLPQPVSIRPASGGLLVLRGRAGAPAYSPAGGGFALSVRGGGLPSLEADVRKLSLANGELIAAGTARAAFSIAPAEGAAVSLVGRLRVAAGQAWVGLDHCALVSVRRLVFGANTIEVLAGQVCPSGEPLLVAGAGGWRFAARVAGVAATVPFLQVRVAEATGQVSARQQGAGMTVAASIDGARVIDASPQTRFYPLRLRGTAGLSRDRWVADFAVVTPAGASLAALSIQHDLRSGRGGLAIDTGQLRFADGGLQASQLSPLVQAVGSPVEGSARFAGQFDWTAQGASSHGVLTLPGLDFQSPAGRVSGLKGTIALASLAPLSAAPGQTLSADSLAAIVPVTHVTAGVGLDAQALTITGGVASVGGGTVRVRSLRIPFAAEAPMTGLLDFEGVQLHDLVEASPFGDRVDLDARVSGGVPFESQAGRVRISGAELHAIQPGRLSIQRQALTGVAASGSVSTPGVAAAPVVKPVPPTDTFTDFAYQAMENLAFDKLDAAVASRADGRLGILAHIVGRHDPPQRQEIRLSLFDLIGRKFLNRPLPLPSNTGVDLTLDTTLNLDDLLADYADYQRLRNSHAVQP